jgi:hypothetical protein
MGVLVLGMHRSGTSALAGALEAMGFDLGPEDDVMPADIGNPEGYFELLSVVRANDDLLARFGGRWDSPPNFAPGWSEDDAANEFVDTSSKIRESRYCCRSGGGSSRTRAAPSLLCVTRWKLLRR